VQLTHRGSVTCYISVHEVQGGMLHVYVNRHDSRAWLRMYCEARYFANTV